MIVLSPMANQSIAEAISTWKEFFGYAGVVASTLLGLLFVALSLRLNIFHDRRLADVRAFAFLNFGSFAGVAFIAGLFHVPDQGRVGLALPVLILGLLGIAGFVYIAWLSARLNTPEYRPGPRMIAAQAMLPIADVGLVVIAIALLGSHAGALPWLAAVSAFVLLAASMNVWILLSNAAPE